MAKERFVKATFSNGREIKRASISKIYTYAYLACGKSPMGQTWEKVGFSGSEDQCRLNMAAETAWLRKSPGYTVEFEQVVAVAVVAAPYENILNAG